jgi:hypothetical protein
MDPMSNIKMLLAAVAFSAISASAASAVVIDFGMQGTVEPGMTSVDVSGGGYTITATAKGVMAGGGTVDSIVTRTGSPINGPNQGGLGVKSPNDTNQSIDGGINVKGPYKDILFLTFNKAVKITKVFFSLVENDRFGADHANIGVDGVNVGNFDISGAGWPAFLAVSLKGTVFSFGALGQNDDYKLRGVEVTPIPVPPAALLLATAVAGIGSLARRKAKKA